MNLFAFLITYCRTVALFCITLSFLLACNSGSGTTEHPSNSSSRPEKIFRLEQPSIDQLVSLGDSISFKISNKKNPQVDSLIVYIEGKKRSVEYNSPLNFSRQGLFENVGRQNLRLKIFYSDSLSQTLTTRLVVLSDIEPKNFSYKVIRKFPHNETDYIQGLIYYQGYLYEGTGKPRQSRLIKTNPADGTTMLERKLDDKFFGEGITRVNDKIYQLTYKHKVGFVYDLESFEQLREFDLQTMEGWGLTFDGENLIVSDGSSTLYFYDPEYFSQVKLLDVANNKGLVNNLNELEYINGIIWANVYTKSIIVKIDAHTGKVLGQLDLDPLFPADIARDYDHVLNGIAYNPNSDTYYVTGKFWPVMYEIKIEK